MYSWDKLRTRSILSLGVFAVLMVAVLGQGGVSVGVPPRPKFTNGPDVEKPLPGQRLSTTTPPNP